MKKETLFTATIWLLICLFVGNIYHWGRLLAAPPVAPWHFPNIETLLPSLHFAQEHQALIGGISIALDALVVLGGVFLLRRKPWAHTLVVSVFFLLVTYQLIHLGMVYFELDWLLQHLTADGQGLGLAGELERRRGGVLNEWLLIAVSAPAMLAVLLSKAQVRQLQS